MNPRTITTLLVSAMFVLFGLAAGCDESATDEPEGAEAQQSASDAAAREGVSTVLLYADMAKADSQCGCGQIIRLCDMMADRGVDIEEIDATDESDTVDEYDLNTDPTVLFLDGEGEELRRFEGERDETIDELREELRELADHS